MSNKKVIPVTNEPQENITVDIIMGNQHDDLAEYLEELEKALEKYIEQGEPGDNEKENQKDLNEAYERAMRGI